MMAESYCSYEDLRSDEACVLLHKGPDILEAWLYSLSSDCQSCPFSRVARFSDQGDTSVKFDTATQKIWRVYGNGEIKHISALNRSNLLCETVPKLCQFGTYKLDVNNDSCQVTTIEQPTDPYIPLLIAFSAIAIFLFGFSLVRIIANLLKKRFRKQVESEEPNKSTGKPRIRSIDTFRGISILFMIFVNDGAGGYYILKHAVWNGLLIGDLIFPCFVWIMGVCIPMSISSQLSRDTSRLSIVARILERSIYLFVIGVSLNTLGTDAQLEKIRIFGVLQRFGIAYLITALLYTLTTRRNVEEAKSPIIRGLGDIVTLLPQWILMLIIIGVHTGLTFYLPVPGCPTGYLGPGGRHEDGRYSECDGGATGYIDRFLLGRDHLYQFAEIQQVYGSGPFDPEGILGCLTSIFQTFLGVQAGKIIITYKDGRNRMIRLLIWAIICGCIGSALHFSGAIPVNKNLWSLSFVFTTSCFAFALFAVCYFFVDAVSIWRGGPFRIPGMNALVMYIGHYLCYQIFPFHWKYGKMATHEWQLGEALWGVSLWTLVAYILHRKRMYLTL